MGTALRLASSGVSDSSGNLTINFAGPSPGEVFTGSVFVSGAPASATFAVTIGSTSGGLPWGSMIGGTALLVQAMGGEVIQVTSSNVVASTTYIAVLAGSIDSDQDVAWTGPFPATPSNSKTTLLVISGGVQPYFIGALGAATSVVAGAGAWTYGTWASIGTTASAGGLGSALTHIVLGGNGAGSTDMVIQLSTGASGGAVPIGGWRNPSGTAGDLISLPQPVLLSAGTQVWARTASATGLLTTSVGLNLFQVTGQVSFA